MISATYSLADDWTTLTIRCWESLGRDPDATPELPTIAQVADRTVYNPADWERCLIRCITRILAMYEAIYSWDPVNLGRSLGLPLDGRNVSAFTHPNTPSDEMEAAIGVSLFIYASLKGDDRIDTAELLNPASPLILAWMQRPTPADLSDRTTKRIIPAKLGMANPEDHRAGRLFSHAAHVGLEGQIALPGFQHDRTAPALPLALYDLGLGATSKGRHPEAPLALRLWVESILAVAQRDRRGNGPVVINITLRNLLAKLYPSNRTPRPNEYWPRIMSAVEALDRMDARVPWHDPTTGRGGLRRVVSVADIPRGAGALDDRVRIIVDLPPGSENGPQVSDNLGRWGLKSAKAYRALLNLAYWWHDPGVSIRPVGKRADAKGVFWSQSTNPDHYPDVTDADKVQLVFPTSARAQFRNLVSEANRVLADLEQAGELQIVKGKIIPSNRTALPPGENDARPCDQ